MEGARAQKWRAAPGERRLRWCVDDEDEDDESEYEGLSEKLVREHGAANKPLAQKVSGKSVLKIFGTGLLTLVKGLGALDQSLFTGPGKLALYFGTLVMAKIVERFHVMEELFDLRAVAEDPKRRADAMDAQLTGRGRVEPPSAESVAEVLGRVQDATVFTMADEEKAEKQYAEYDGSGRQLTDEQRRVRYKVHEPEEKEETSPRRRRRPTKWKKEKGALEADEKEKGPLEADGK